MSGPFGSSQWMYNAGGGFYDHEIDNSLRLERNDNTYLLRNFATGNRRTYTRSFWFKRSKIEGAERYFYSVTTSNSDAMLFETDERIRFGHFANTYRLTTSQKFRDVGAWYHIVERVDTTQGTASNRWRIYVNGVQVTAFDVANYPPQNYDTKHNVSGNAHHLMTNEPSSNNFSGYVAEYNYIDGQSLGPESFGEFKSGIWIPKEYSGSYGTNGFHLEFAGNTNDTSGNGNNYTANNISAYDYVPDSPTSNFSTLSPLTAGSVGTLTQGSLQPGNGSGADAHGIAGTFGMPAGTGKWYWEVFINNPNVNDNYPYVGACAGQRLNSNATYGTRGTDLKLNCGTGGVDTSTTYVGSITTVTTGLSRIEDNNILGVAVDMENRKMWFSENGVFPNSGNPATGANPTFTWTNDIDLFPHWFSYNTYGSGSVWNFGQDSSFVGNKTAQGNTDGNGVGDFYYSPPSGFLALCSANLPAPAIDPLDDASPTDYFDTILYTAATSNGTYTHGDLSFQPDFSWIKNRNNVEEHYLIDVVRGNTSVTNKFLNTNSLDAEGAAGVSGTTFSVTSTGYEFVETSINSGELYFNGRTYAGWNWKAGGTAVSNTDGSITSSVSASPTSGFSIVTYTGNGTNSSTVGHGLLSAPEFVIVKSRSNSRNWVVEHNQGKGMYLNLTNDGASAGSNTMTQQSSTIRFDVSNDGNRSVNFNSETYVAYCFHSVDGFSKAGSYVGNGSSDGPMVVTGFRPAWVVIKRYDSSNNWNSHDNKRGPYNVNDWRLYMNLSSAEDSGGSYGVDFLSNGFKVRTSEAGWNASGGTYIYLAFAEQPFKYANAR